MQFKIDVDKFYLAIDKAIDAGKTTEDVWEWHKETVERGEFNHVILSAEEIKPIIDFM